MFYDILPRVVLGFWMHYGLKITNAPIRELGHHLTPGQGRVCRGVGAQIFPKTWGQLGCRGTLVGQCQGQSTEALNAAHYFGQHLFVWKHH